LLYSSVNVCQSEIEFIIIMELENGEGEKKKKEDRLNVPTG
jgi:hypothetical protein